MSILNDIVDGPITDFEVQKVLKVIADTEIKRERVYTALGAVMGDVEKMDRTCKAIIMSAADWQVVHKYLGVGIKSETRAAVLMTGLMATYCGTEIRVSKGFEDGMVGVPNIPEADGTLIVLREVAL